MNLPIPEVRMGEPMPCGELAVFPLFAEPVTALDYLLSREAMAAGTLTVQEASEEARCPSCWSRTAATSPSFSSRARRFARRQAEPAVVRLDAGRGQEPDDYPGRLRGAGTLGVRDPSLRERSCCPPSLRHFLKQMANAWDISGRLDGQLSLWQAIRSKHGRLDLRSEYREPVRRAGDAPAIRSKSCDGTCPMPRARRESPSKSAASSCR